MTLDFVTTGIAGLDDLLDYKGIPSGHTVLLSGSIGNGKTTIAIQFLFQGATQYHQSGLHISLDEDPADIKRNMLNFGWDLAKAGLVKLIMPSFR
jgi:circadian clock protein KaiC